MHGLSLGWHSINVTVAPDEVRAYDEYSFSSPLSPNASIQFKIFSTTNLSVLSPQNKAYNTTSVPLTFTVNESATWTAYSLDNQTPVAIYDNTTLTDLAAGSHRIAVYANDTFGHISNSDIIEFSVATLSSPSLSPSITQSPAPSPSIPEFPSLIVLPLLLLATASFLVFCKKRLQKQV